MSKTGILLINIGTPLSDEPNDVGDYLSEFLMDPFVIDIPSVLRWILVRVLIVPRRKYPSSRAYKKIWMQAGSPLLVYSEALSKNLGLTLGQDYSVKVGMRYSQPSIRAAIKEFANENIAKLLVIPMYPQFADSSTTSSLKRVSEEIQAQEFKVSMSSLAAFYDQSEFVESFVEMIRESVGEQRPDHYLFSYHGLPERQIQRLHPGHCFRSQNCCLQMTEENKNCYRAQCIHTTKRLSNALGLRQDQFSLSFQSRLGRTKWIEPYTDRLLPELAKRGIKRLAVVCPSFVADCLETLEEIGIRGRQDFIKAGGQELILVPCLNAHPTWVQALAKMIKELV